MALIMAPAVTGRWGWDPRMLETNTMDAREHRKAAGLMGALGLVTLDRPESRNAVDAAFRQQLADALPQWARNADVYAVVLRSGLENVFSSGADLHERLGWALGDGVTADQHLANELRLIWLLDCFTKPIVSLIDGAVLGSGAGLVNFGTHRVAGESYSFAMPDAALGWVPDAGMAHVLAGMARQVGYYLALSGRAIGRADAFALGLVTHCLPRAQFASVIDALAAADVVDPLLDTLHVDPGQGVLAERIETIERCFAGPSVADILARLDSEQGLAQAWAAEVARDIRQRSPFALALTLAQMRRAVSLDLRAILELDFRLMRHCLRRPDFVAGVRAQQTGMEQRPAWMPERIADVSAQMIEQAFAASAGVGLELKPRAILQTDMEFLRAIGAADGSAT